MYTSITIFYISFLAIIGMIWYKRHENMTGKPTVISRAGAGIDHIFHSVFDTVGNVISYVNKHTFIALAHWLAFHVLVHVRKIYVELKHIFISHPQGKKMIDAVRGRGEVRKHGVSFYLRRISKGDK